MLLRGLQQYFNELTAQQTRFNLHLLVHVAELEDRRARRCRGADATVIVHQVLSGAGPVDAVTSQARAFRALFARWGWGGRDVAGGIDPRIARRGHAAATRFAPSRRRHCC